MAKKSQDKGYTVARASDGVVQINFKIAWSKIEKEREHAATHMAANITVPGFRKGKAPLAKAIGYLPEEKLIEHTLSHILPELLSKALKAEKVRPAIYPKFQLIKAKEGEDWEVSAKTCELPEINLGSYKTKIKKAIKPGKGKDAKKLTNEERDNKIIEAVLASYKIKIPDMLVEEEANSRLASLLERLEKLGLSLEGYLASMKKTGEDLRAEYSEQARKSITLDIVLQEIASKEKLEVSQKETSQYMSASGMTPEQENTVKLFLRKRKALDILSELV